VVEELEGKSRAVCRARLVLTSLVKDTTGEVNIAFPGKRGIVVSSLRERKKKNHKVYVFTLGGMM
jgi:hypothetical protein